MSAHKQVQTALRDFDALSPADAQAALSPLERGMAIAVYDSGTDGIDTMHQANRIACAVRAYLSAVGETRWSKPARLPYVPHDE